MDIRFEDGEKFKVTGYAIETDLGSNDSDVGLLWQTYKNSLLSLPEANSCLYGVLWYTENHSYYYLLGIKSNENSKLDNATTVVAIPSAYFAVATVPSHMTVSEAWTQYFERELPSLGYEPNAEHGKYFEFYNGDGKCELWTPVKKQEIRV